MCPLLRHSHFTHLLSKAQVECIIYHSGMDLSLKITIHPTSLRMMIPQPIRKQSWVVTLKMAQCHEIQNGLHVYQPSLDFDWCAWGCDLDRLQIGLQEEDWSDGQVETYKTRLVVKNFRQKPDVDYEETFLPVAMLKSIRIMLAVAAFHDYEI